MGGNAADPHSFNTQPPEGGWDGIHNIPLWQDGFNTQPPEGGWDCMLAAIDARGWFQHTAA